MRRNRLIKTGAASLLCGLAALAALALAAPKNPPKGPPAETPPGNGQVEIGLSKDSNVLDFENAAIGDHINDSVVVSNDGKLAADFKLVGELTATPSASLLADQLQLVVSRGTTQLYSGSVADFNAASGFNLGTLYPKQGNKTPKNLTLNFQLSFPTTGTSGGDNLLQNLGPIDQRFRIDAIQSTGAQSNSPAGGNSSKPTPTVAGKSQTGTGGGSTSGSPAGLTAPGAAAAAPTDLAPIADLGAGVGGKKAGSEANEPTGNPPAGGGTDAAPETVGAPTKGGAGQPADDEGPRGTLLLLGIFGCAAALILWWGLKTPAGARA
jgi:hypothetical protein